MKRQPVVCSLVVVTVFGVGIAGAQSLGDLAKKEQERQKTVKGTGKVYTDKDVAKYPPAPGPGDAAAKPGVPSPDDSAAPVAKPAAQTARETPSGEEKGQAYWKGLLKDVQARIDRDRSAREALQEKLSSFDTIWVDRDDVLLRARIGQERAKAEDEIARLTKAIDNGVKEIEKIREDARRQGVPPGWLR